MRGLLAVVLALLAGCAARKSGGAFEVAPGKPFYKLNTPDSKTVAFPDVQASFTRSAFGWLDLRPGMLLRIENAVYREGALKRDIQSFVRVDVLRYRVGQDGRLVPEAAEKRAAVKLAPTQTRFKHHRFYYQITFKRVGAARTAVLLGAKADAELVTADQLLRDDPDAICGQPGGRCSTFPDTCTVSVEIEIKVNGAVERVQWGSWLSNVVQDPGSVELLRPYKGRLTPVHLDIKDPNALRLPLLPGDEIRWEAAKTAPK